MIREQMFEFGKEGADVVHAWLLWHITHVWRWANAGRQGKDCCSDGEGMAEGFQDRAIPLGREKLGEINSAIWKGWGLCGQC